MSDREDPRDPFDDEAIRQAFLASQQERLNREGVIPASTVAEIFSDGYRAALAAVRTGDAEGEDHLAFAAGALLDWWNGNVVIEPRLSDLLLQLDAALVHHHAQGSGEEPRPTRDELVARVALLEATLRERDALRKLVQWLDSSSNYWMRRAGVPDLSDPEEAREEVALAFDGDDVVLDAYRAALASVGTPQTTEQ